MSAATLVGGFLLICALWLLQVVLRGSERMLGRLTWNWPIPYWRMSPGGQRGVRVAGALLALVLLGLAAWRLRMG